jgi:tRNA(His) 5'-end guanylyltransferase
MKENYEKRAQSFLTRRTPAIIRVDGKAFHTFTKKFEKPFSEHLSNLMVKTAIQMCQEIQGAKCAYTQSDEISILLTDYDDFQTQAWFDYNVQKMTSVAASISTAAFNRRLMSDWLLHKLEMDSFAQFDARVFNIPKEEVLNYFRWRYQDWIRNSVTMLAGKYYSHKQLHKKNQADMHEMIYQAGDNWTNLEDKWKNGVWITKVKEWVAHAKCPDVMGDEFIKIIEDLI